ncbi:P-loop containing nucleoside triphosphate hydrolase protein [Tricholoma matsutake]|nr:P-loop containing nucleoside triphosphate hydrolase protein [Tricholoma matsutake 945]
MDITSVSTLEEHLNQLRLSSAEDIELLLQNTINSERLPLVYWNALSNEDRITASRACLLAYAVAGGTQVPRELQLRACLATYHAHDSLIDAGTGSGKTLPIALNLLLDDPRLKKICLTISPLKRLQVTQANNFNLQYGIPTIAINDDTPRDDSYWNEHVHNLKSKEAGTARHIIVTVEQLFKTPEGHLPCLAILLRNKHFQRRIGRIHVDEAHFIHTAGLGHYGGKPFRPAWAQLDELKAILPRSIPWQALSATLRESKILSPNYISIRISSNRPNTMYATHRVISNLEEPRNYECFLRQPFDLRSQPRVLIFFDDTDLAAVISDYLDAQLPADLRGKGIVRHYHSGMSETYLQRAHAAFTDPDGICKILCATSGESIGVDFPDVDIVCNAGLPSNIVDMLQRGGRVGRREGSQGFHGNSDDPDRPRALLKPAATRKDRAPLSCVRFVQCKQCLRMFFANYLGDTTENGV